MSNWIWAIGGLITAAVLLKPRTTAADGQPTTSDQNIVQSILGGILDPLNQAFGGAIGGFAAPMTKEDLAKKYLGKTVGSMAPADKAILEQYARASYHAVENVDHGPFLMATTNPGHDWDGGSAFRNGVVQIGVTGGLYDASEAWVEEWNKPNAIFQSAQMIRHHGKTVLEKAVALVSDPKNIASAGAAIALI